MALDGRPPQHQDRRLVLRERKRLIDERLVVNYSLWLESTARGEDGARFGVVDSFGELCEGRKGISGDGLRSACKMDVPFGAKPPKTTEWIAPILAQASMAIAPSKIIGICVARISARLIPRIQNTTTHVNDDPIPFLDPKPVPQNPREHFNLIQHFLVAHRPARTRRSGRQRRVVVEARPSAEAGENMSV
jgi:hypothetical protein